MSYMFYVCTMFFCDMQTAESGLGDTGLFEASSAVSSLQSSPSRSLAAPDLRTSYTADALADAVAQTVQQHLTASDAEAERMRVKTNELKKTVTKSGIPVARWRSGFKDDKVTTKVAYAKPETNAHTKYALQQTIETNPKPQASLLVKDRSANVAQPPYSTQDFSAYDASQIEKGDGTGPSKPAQKYRSKSVNISSHNDSSLTDTTLKATTSDITLRALEATSHPDQPSCDSSHINRPVSPSELSTQYAPIDASPSAIKEIFPPVVSRIPVVTVTKHIDDRISSSGYDCTLNVLVSWVLQCYLSHSKTSMTL